MLRAAGFPIPPGGAFIGTNTAYAVAQSAIPFIIAATGTMGNNGAVTLGTALPSTYSTGAWVLYPAGAVAAGVPAAAAWLWTVFTSGTVGTVFNSTYTSGVPTVGAQTSFVTTGPGAFTGVTGAQTGPQYTIKGGSIGSNGSFLAINRWTQTNNANAKSVNAKLGASLLNAFSLASAASASEIVWFQNRGTQAAQLAACSNTGYAGIGTTAGAFIYTTIDTSADQVMARVITKGIATDNMVLEGFVDQVMFAP